MSINRRLDRMIRELTQTCHDCSALADPGCTRCRRHRLADADRAKRKRALGRTEKP